MVVPWSYRGWMSSVVKRSFSLPAPLFRGIEDEAREAGIPLSAALTEAAQQWLTVRRGLRAVAEWEAENGALTDAELAEADALLDQADQGARRPADAR